jgi:curved DNA-binding protein CbpA
MVFLAAMGQIGSTKPVD